MRGGSKVSAEQLTRCQTSDGAYRIVSSREVYQYERSRTMSGTEVESRQRAESGEEQLSARTLIAELDAGARLTEATLESAE